MQPTNIDYSPEAENIPGFLLWQVSKLWQRHLNSTLKDLKLSSTQAVILSNIVRSSLQGHEVTQIMLSQFTKIDAMTTSTAVRSLERKRLIIRHIPDSNRRSYVITPTDEGRRVAMAVLQKFVKAHEEFFGPLKTDVGNLGTYLQILKQANDIKEIS